MNCQSSYPQSRLSRTSNSVPYDFSSFVPPLDKLSSSISRPVRVKGQRVPVESLSVYVEGQAVPTQSLVIYVGGEAIPRESLSFSIDGQAVSVESPYVDVVGQAAHNTSMFSIESPYVNVNSQVESTPLPPSLVCNSTESAQSLDTKSLDTIFPNNLSQNEIPYPDVPPLTFPLPVTIEDIHNMKQLEITCPSDDEISDTDATINSIPYTIVDGEAYPCRYRNQRHIVKMSVPINIASFQFQALVDTGADFSAIRAEIYESLRHAVHRESFIQPFAISLSVNSQDSYRINKQAELYVSINGNKILWKFYVVPNLTNEVVLGLDFLEGYDVQISYRRRKLIFGVKPADDFPNTQFKHNSNRRSI